MNISKPTHLVLFALIVGFATYLSSALWSAIFIVSVPVDRDAVTAFSEVSVNPNSESERTKLIPVEFKSTFEELKYHHNVEMLERNKRYFYATMLLGGLLGLLAFYVVPKWKGKLEGLYDKTGLVLGSAVLGVAVVIFVPFLFASLLPPPVNWFPKEIKDISDLREQDALNRLRERAQRIDATSK